MDRAILTLITGFLSFYLCFFLFFSPFFSYAPQHAPGRPERAEKRVKQGREEQAVEGSADTPSYDGIDSARFFGFGG